MSGILIAFLLRITIVLFFYIYKKYDFSEPLYYYKTSQYVFKYQEFLGLNVTFAVILGIHALRVLYILKASRTFGPMIEIIINMLRQVCIFMFIEA